MGFAEAVKTGLSNFFNATGRSSRSAYWWYYLCVAIIAGVVGVIGGFNMAYGIEQVWIGIILEVLVLVLEISLICAGIRRLHDTGRSGFNILWCLLPVIGGILLIVYWCQPSQPGENQYGPEPR